MIHTWLTDECLDVCPKECEGERGQYLQRPVPSAYAHVYRHACRHAKSQCRSNNAYIVMAYTVMAYTVMAYIGMTYIAAACIGMANIAAACIEVWPI